MAQARIMTVSDTVDIDVDADTLYSLVSDPRRIPEWSPENREATVLNPAADGAAFVGMTFEGRNKRGRAKWITRCTVTAADPGRRFAFTAHTIGVKKPRLHAPNASWEYRFEPIAGGGTRVTETWNDDRAAWPNPVVAVFDRIVTSGKTFPEFQRVNIRKTLDTPMRRWRIAARPAGTSGVSQAPGDVTNVTHVSHVTSQAASRRIRPS